MRKLMRARAFSLIPAVAVLLLMVSDGSLARTAAIGDVAAAKNATVIDGDTIELAGQVVQLHGVDAPELGQRCLKNNRLVDCGMSAAFELNKIIGIVHGAVECKKVGTNAGTVEAVCNIGETDLSYALIVAGYAISTADQHAYHLAQEKAQRASLGLWHSEFIDPRDWRAGKRLPGEVADDDESCPIKGVIYDNDRYYFVPTDEGYETLSIDTSKGEQHFCSDEEARDAGWQRAASRLHPNGPA